MKLQIYTEFVLENGAVLREMHKDAFDIIEDDRLEEKMISAQEYEENICSMATGVRCTLSAQQQVDAGTS